MLSNGSCSATRPPCSTMYRKTAVERERGAAHIAIRPGLVNAESPAAVIGTPPPAVSIFAGHRGVCEGWRTAGTAASVRRLAHAESNALSRSGLEDPRRDRNGSGTKTTAPALP